jgi:hypothetical protein
MAATPSPATPTPSAQDYADVYVVKLDANGNLQWTKTIGGKSADWGSSLIQTSDGGYAIAGSTFSSGTGAGWWGEDVYVVKLDANGNLQWTKTIGGPAHEIGFSLIQTSDGGYAIAGYTESFGAGSGDVYVVKLDANGNLQWTKTIGGPESGRAPPSFRPPMAATPSPATPNPSAQEMSGDVYVVKLDANGNLQWTKTIGAKNKNYSKSSLIQTSDGGYAIAGKHRILRRRRVGCLCRQAGQEWRCLLRRQPDLPGRVRWQAAQRYLLHRQRRHPHLPHPQHQLRRHPHQPVPIAETKPASTLQSTPPQPLPLIVNLSSQRPQKLPSLAPQKQ